MDEAKFVNRLDRQHTLGHVEPRHVLAEGVVLDQHGHEISSGQELHQEVEVVRVLERVVELNDPGRVGFGEHISFGADVRELSEREGLAEWSERERTRCQPDPS